MKADLECIPCFINQAHKASNLATDDSRLQEKILKEVLYRLSHQSFDTTPPFIGRDIHRIVKLLTGKDDPYREIKEDSNRLAERLMPSLKKIVKDSKDSFETAVRLSIAGNTIDYGQGNQITEQMVKDAISRNLSKPIDKESVEGLREEIEKASKILYLGDNAGEVFFDKLLLTELIGFPVKFVVRGAPIINDALVEDARAAGIDEIVEVLENGADIPGTMLEECSENFKREFVEADLIISKGQGNYETLSDEQKNIFFLFMSKCPVISRDIGFEQGEMVVFSKMLKGN